MVPGQEAKATALDSGSLEDTWAAHRASGSARALDGSSACFFPPVSSFSDNSFPQHRGSSSITRAWLFHAGGLTAKQQHSK